MKGLDPVIEILNESLTHELTAINQYFIHGRMLQNWGYQRLADKLMAESIEEMKHAQTLIDKILFLEGVPNLQKLGKVNVGQTVPEMLECDLAAEISARELYNRAVDLCRTHSDHGTAELFEKLVLDEEEHIDWIEAQQDLIKQVGVENYLAQQIRA
ncbi:MAG: bacterioferritin [Planctomycetota bacterium]